MPGVAARGRERLALTGREASTIMIRRDCPEDCFCECCEATEALLEACREAFERLTPAGQKRCLEKLDEILADVKLLKNPS